MRCRAVPEHHTGDRPLPDFRAVRVNPTDEPPHTAVVCNFSSACTHTVPGLVNTGILLPSVPVNPVGNSLAKHPDFAKANRSRKRQARPTPRASLAHAATPPAAQQPPPRRPLSVQAPARKPNKRNQKRFEAAV